MTQFNTSAYTLFIFSIGLIWTLQSHQEKKAKKSSPKVSKLVIFPIKSCGGIEVQSAVVTRRGLKFDRSFMVVDDNGNFVTQRKKPSMALIQTRIDIERGVLVITAPSMPILEVSLEEGNADEINTLATVWGDKCEAKIVPTDGWFAKFLDIPGLQLVRFSDSFVRQTDAKYAPKGQTGFADGYPFLLASEGSIQELNRRGNFQITMDRFRPNIIVDGCSPFAEDGWKSITFQSSPLMKTQVVKPCSRCSIPDVDPSTATYDKEMKVSRVLKTFRTGEDLKLSEEKWKKQV